MYIVIEGATGGALVRAASIKSRHSKVVACKYSCKAKLTHKEACKMSADRMLLVQTIGVHKRGAAFSSWAF
jgi:hypothetical protein